MHKTVDTKQYDSLPLGNWWARRLHWSSHQIDLREKYSVKKSIQIFVWKFWEWRNQKSNFEFSQIAQRLCMRNRQEDLRVLMKKKMSWKSTCLCYFLTYRHQEDMPTCHTKSRNMWQHRHARQPWQDRVTWRVDQPVKRKLQYCLIIETQSEQVS